MKLQKVQAVFFDLDGTLLDTAPDLAAALNRLLVEHGLPEKTAEEMRSVAGHGSQALLTAGFSITADDPRTPFLKKRFLELYAENPAEKTLCFAGIPEVLSQLEALHIPWGIVTNRPYKAALWVTKLHQLARRAACIVAGDTLSVMKPDPAPLLHACDLIKHTARNCLYVGDMKTDIEAATRAGMPSLVAGYGYTKKNEDLNTWGAAGVIDKPEDILKWLNQI